MKHLNQFITEYIVKKKLDKAIDSEDHYIYFPKTKQELIENIKELVDKGETDFNCIDTSAITNMSHLFDDIDINRNFDVSKWNVSNVEDMGHMFYAYENFDCDLSNWNVSKVKDMKYMFYKCENFTGKGLENWDVSKVEDMQDMFEDCENFDCDLSKWDVSNVLNMEYMFRKCKKLNFDLSNWNVSKVKNTYNMFYGCNILKNIPSWY